MEHVKNHCPDRLRNIEENFDISHILDKPDPKEGANFLSDSGSDAESVDDQSDTEGTFFMDPARDSDTSRLFLDI